MSSAVTFRTGSIRNATTLVHDDIALKDHILNLVDCRRALRPSSGESHGGDSLTAVARRCGFCRGNGNQITPFGRPANLRRHNALSAGQLVKAAIPKNASWRDDTLYRYQSTGTVEMLGDPNFPIAGRTGTDGNTNMQMTLRFRQESSRRSNRKPIMTFELYRLGSPPL